MKILILEGVATSGKSSIIESLQRKLKNQQLKVYGEPKTYVPIMKQPSKLHLDFFNSLLTEAINTNANYIIFDRLYLTQAFRAKANIFDYQDIENLLMQRQVLTAFLVVDEAALADRVELASEHRDKTWDEYVKSKGETFEDIAQYYVDQQRSQLILLANSKIKSKVFNTTQHKYEEIADKILKILA